MIRYGLLVVVMLMVGCTGHIANWDGDALKSDLVVLEYNSVMSQYRERPTFVGLASRKNQGDVLSIKVAMYSGDTHLMLPEEHADRYIAQIDKYFEWEALASERRDMVDLEISTEPGWGGGFAGYQIRAKMGSASESLHLLMLTQCIGSCAGGPVDTFTFTRRNALILRDLLERLRDGELKGADTSVYQ